MFFVGTGYCIHFLSILVFQIFKNLHSHFLGNELYNIRVYNIVHVYYLGLLLGPCLEAKKGSYESTTVSQSVLGKSLSQVIYENALNQLD